jgi:hypothetical protein
MNFQIDIESSTEKKAYKATMTRARRGLNFIIKNVSLSTAFSDQQQLIQIFDSKMLPNRHIN